MDRPFPVATVASCFALAGFAVAVFAGLGSERSMSDVLGAALGALTVCYGIGFVAARMAEIGVRERVDAILRTTTRRTGGAFVTDGSDVEIVGDLPDQGTERARSV